MIFNAIRFDQRLVEYFYDIIRDRLSEIAEEADAQDVANILNAMRKIADSHHNLASSLPESFRNRAVKLLNEETVENLDRNLILEALLIIYRNDIGKVGEKENLLELVREARHLIDYVKDELSFQKELLRLEICEAIIEGKGIQELSAQKAKITRNINQEAKSKIGKRKLEDDN
jgi:hypothetical protein